MSSQATPPPPPVPASPPNSGGVRRHHTISASSRAARTAARDSVHEEDQNTDEFVGGDWVGGSGAVGEETSSLHRQSSLPTKYHRGFQGNPKSGNKTPKNINSLAAIAGHEGDEEPWNIAGGYPVEDDHTSTIPEHHQVIETQQSKTSPLSPHLPVVPHDTSPPAATNVRRHVSLTHGPNKKMNATGLKRSGTLQAGPVPSHNPNTPPPDTSEGVEDEYAYDAEDPNIYDEGAQQYPYNQGQQYPASPIGRQSPWASGNEWRSTAFTGGNNNSNQNATIDDVQRALSALELASNQVGQNQMYQNTTYNAGQSIHPPRFNPPSQTPSMRSGGNNNGNGNGRQLQLQTDPEGRKTPQSHREAYAMQQSYQHQGDRQSSGGSWDNEKRTLTPRSSNPNLQYGYQQNVKAGSAGVPSVPPIPPQYLQQQQQQQQSRMGAGMASGQQQQGAAGQPNFSNTPIDVPSLIATKGYNPTEFDTRPPYARYFVIKSYTEDDVHKSLKYEIWSSTDPGNKRLDKAFKETNGRGPIYLFFSVNASGHFCGMAEMLTPVDYTRSSTVWASDKWKGVFTVRWIFVRDIPNVNLRHIKLNNTQERKPVTNSRDTQELLPDAGQEMLRIFHTHPARTSLLQDFAFYELQSMQKLQNQQGASSPTQSADTSSHSPPIQHQQQASQPQHPQQQNMYGLSPNAIGYHMPQISPVMQMGMGTGMGMPMPMNSSQYGMPPSQAMHQSVMRHPSPGPQNLGGQGFMF